uniref:TIL domain-containing protein n=1 Tax=Caenorhabditis japonica TaxID=281687 RepID=A0A8R1E2P9_CAEJA
MHFQETRIICFAILLVIVMAQKRNEPQCARNEELKECGSACEPTCKDPVPFCRFPCINNVCQCVLGFVRHPTTGNCVRQNQCPDAKNCGVNETFSECGTACEPSCSNPEPRMCTRQCIVDVCQCSPGFVRGTKGCVRKDHC